MIKLSNREKTLIYVSLLLLFFVAVFKFLIVPTSDRMLAMEEEIVSKQEASIEYSTTIASRKQYESEIQSLVEKIAKETEDLNGILPNEGMDELMQSFMKKFDITCEVTAGSVALSKAGAGEVLARGGASDEAGTLYIGTVAIVGAGAHSDIISFAGHFASEPAVRLTSFSVDQSDTFSATFDIYMYG